MECVLSPTFGDNQTDDDISSDSECNSEDEECVDILNDSPHRTLANTSTKNSNSVSGNKFSIDRILGINNDDNQVFKTNNKLIDKNSDECEKDVQFVKPTPLQASQRNGINLSHNFLPSLKLHKNIINKKNRKSMNINK